MMNSKEVCTTIMVVDDEGKLHNFIGKAVNEWRAAYDLFFTFVGDKLGLFKAMAGAEQDFQSSIG